MAPREWGHPEGMPLEDVEIGKVYAGIVTNVSPYGVFVDFGAVKDGLLRVAAKRGRDFRKGFEVQRLTVLSCDPGSGRVVMQPDDDSMPEPKPRAASQRPPMHVKATAGDGGGARQASSSLGPGRRGQSAGPRRRRPARDWAHPDALPLDDLQVGEAYEGTVTNVSPYGVFVDIGAEKDVRLSVPVRIGRRFRIGDVVANCRLEVIDLERQVLSASLDDPEGAVRDLPPKERTKTGVGAKASAKAVAKPGAKQRASSAGPGAAPPRKVRGEVAPAAKLGPASTAAQPRMALEDVMVNSIVTGVVTGRRPVGVFVDIGCVKDAKLKVPKSVGKEFRRGDEVCGMVVEVVDLDKQQIVVSLDEPELITDPEAGMEEAPPVQAPGQPKSKAKSKGKAKAKLAANERPPPRPRIREGAVLEGVVTRVGTQAVFLDIGAPEEGVLKLPKRVAQQFRAGDEVRSLYVESIDAASGRVELSLEDPDMEPEEPEPLAAAPEPAPSRTPGTGARSASRPSRAEAKPKSAPKAKDPRAEPKAEPKREKKWGHDEGIPLEELRVGEEVSGVVTNVNQYGAFLHIGAVKDGRLNVLPRDRKKFTRGDRVEGVIIESVNVGTGQISLTLPYELGDAPEDDIDPYQEDEEASEETDQETRGRGGNGRGGRGGGGARGGRGGRGGRARPPSSGRTAGARSKGPVRQ